jgi:hypothetical protein
MSLNVCAYSNLVKSAIQNPDDYSEITQFFVHPLSVKDVDRFFPGRRDGIEVGVVYDFGTRQEFGLFYDQYNLWREQLSRLVINIRPDAFYELIEFSDSEGVIGPIVSRKLAGDFSEFEEQARRVDNAFHAIYLKWKNAFELAANNGAVQFQ